MKLLVLMLALVRDYHERRSPVHDYEPGSLAPCGADIRWDRDVDLPVDCPECLAATW